MLMFLLAFLIFSSCSQQKSNWQGSIEVADGVTVVRNPKEPMYPEDVFSLEEELSIGEALGKKDYMFSQIKDIAIDEKERIYVLDGKEVHIKVYDKNGDYLRTIGRKGQGPGELEFPMGIRIFSHNKIIVYEGRSLVYFKLDGEFIKEVQLTKTNSPQWYEVDSDGNIIGNFAMQMKMSLMKYDYDQELVFTVTQVEPFGKAMDRLFSPILSYFSVTEENNIIWGKSINYELNITNPEGILLRKIITDYDPIEITEEDERLMSESIKTQRKVELPKYFQPLESTSFSCDEKGRIFVKRREGAESFFYDIFDPEGRCITKIRLSGIDRWIPLQWKNNKLYLVVLDDEGFQYVNRYKVTWKI